MKKFVFSFILICGALAFILSGCKGDTGPAGLAGANGTDGTDGVDGNVTCLQCHSGTVKAKINAQFAQSQHALGDIAVAYAGGRGSCAYCHSHEGYVEWATFGSSSDYTAPTAWKCETCHGLHQTFDSTDYAFRAGGAVTLIADGTTILDEGNNNTCINCHQFRRDRASYDGTADATFTRKFTSASDIAYYSTTTAIGPAGSVTVYGTDSVVVVFDVPVATHSYINSTHAGPHHGPQANLWSGLGGAVTGTMFNGHKGGCVECHMDDNNHSFIPQSATCIACHSDGTDKQGDMDDIEDRIQDVGEALELIYAVHYSTSDGAWHPVYASLTTAQFDAFWHFMVCLEDKSNGAHNPNYVDAMLDQAETALGIK
ncbi:MAG: hypothetical protein H8E98_08005 [Bacteroidetes bacterium]|nr:hypothetical protein [Bacteroidota bacterium]